MINNMVGQSVLGYSYKRKDMVVNMSTKTVECESENINNDNQLLFQRLLAIAGSDQMELESALCFELNSQPASLFEKDGLMKTPNKSTLADAIWEMTGKQMPALPTDDVYWMEEEISSTSFHGRKVKRFSRFASVMLIMLPGIMEKMPSV